ncbi:MAG: YhcH/YjgK/YiaL family protein [Stomatobaculum sp.]|nr:YhcH/YjgK/YiaL family protein [Stomatobaculum sp.]
MVFSGIKYVLKYDYLSEKFTAAYKWLQETDLDALTEGKHPIMGDDVVADLQLYRTEPAEQRNFETHDAFFDIQYMAKGIEAFGVCRREDLKKVKQAFPENDLTFYEEPENKGEMILQEGDLIVVAPEEGHKPRCAAGEPMDVRKIVIKVRV